MRAARGTSPCTDGRPRRPYNVGHRRRRAVSDPSDLRIACAPSVFRVPAGAAFAASAPLLDTAMYEIAPLLDDPIHNLKTIRDVFRWAITEMENAEISYGHGSPDSWEEASFLICRVFSSSRLIFPRRS